ncbi:MAG: (2Fe-2S)-binding protein [Chloroflexi bacterium]|nr:(2Fe-2S)-binding protein [Chloroflexota bacterium]
MKQRVTLNINGTEEEVYAEPWWSLAQVLREEFGLGGTKIACNTGDCGACTVLLDGKAVRSCLILAVKAQGRKVVTIEGLRGKDGGLHPLQQAFMEHFAVQCGYCTPGMILTAKSLLDENPAPTEEEVREGMSGNLCRCTGYAKIVEAVMAASARMRGEHR